MLRQKIYDKLFGDLELPTSTSNLYYKFLEKLKNDVKILDVGVGTGIYFENENCVKLIKEKNVKILGIDINQDDIELASQRISTINMEKSIEVRCIDLFKFDIDLNEFDIILFSESYPVISKDLMNKMLMYIVELNGFSGELIFINNIEDNPKWLQKNFKRFLKYIMFGIDFGRLVSTDDMIEMFTSVGIENEVTFELLASSTPNYALFRDKIKLPGLDCEMKQYMISVKM